MGRMDLPVESLTWIGDARKKHGARNVVEEAAEVLAVEWKHRSELNRAGSAECGLQVVFPDTVIGVFWPCFDPAVYVALSTVRAD